MSELELTHDEARWLRRFERVMKDIPDSIRLRVSQTGGVRAHRRPETADESCAYVRVPSESILGHVDRMY